MFKNIKIAPKLIIAFASIALLVGAVGYVSLRASQRALQDSLGQNSETLARAIMDNVDKELSLRVNDARRLASYPYLVTVVTESNEEFAALSDARAYIDAQDLEWSSATATTPFMRSIIEHHLSAYLRDTIAQLEIDSRYKVFGEIFLTNRYGANVAASGRTSDYRQDDEEWWQMARDGGLSIHGIEYDESADTYSTDISVRITDADGAFAGVLKAVLNIEGVMAVMDESAKVSNFETAVLRLIDSRNKIIFDSSDHFKFLDDVGMTEFAKVATGQEAGYALDSSPTLGVDTFFAYARSDGYRNFPGLGWLLILQYDLNEVLAPAGDLRNTLAFLSLFTMVFAIMVGVLLSRAISRPIVQARDAAVEIARGNMNVKIATNRKDEIGVLMSALERMRVSLRTVMEEYEKKVKL